jgi:hypothetical protein
VTAPNIAVHHYCEEHAAETSGQVSSGVAAQAMLRAREFAAQADERRKRHDEQMAKWDKRREEDVQARDLFLAELRKITDLLTRLVDKLDR